MKHKNIYRISISLLLAFVMALPTIAQNTKTFKGVVLDETEQPIIGAAIKVVGTTVGTITDLDGNFTFAGLTKPTYEPFLPGSISRTVCFEHDSLQSVNPQNGGNHIFLDAREEFQYHNIGI